MGKKYSQQNQDKKDRNSQKNSSKKKENKIITQTKKKKNKNKRKKQKENVNSKNSSYIKRDKYFNHPNFSFNNININYNNNQFIFNSILNPNKENEKPEWMSPETQKIQNINIRFSKEIFEYANYIIPKNISLSQRESTKQRLINIIKKYQPQWQIFLFGSFSQNTSTVFSDLDFAVISNEDSSRKMDINELIYLMKILRKEGFSRNIHLIPARVPILKATCSFTGINVDISVNRDNGWKAAKMIRKILEKYTILKPSIIFLKILLKKNNLNDACIGGMSSFLLFHLVYFFFLTYQKRMQKGIYSDIDINNIKKGEKNLGESFQYKNNQYKNSNNNEEDDYYKEKEISYDSNNALKWENNSKRNGITPSKAYSSSEDDNSSDDDTNLVKNGKSFSNSEEEQKSNINRDYTNYRELKNKSNSKNNNNYNEDYEYDSDENNEDDDEDINKEKNNEINITNLNSNYNIGHFIFAFLRFYGKEFEYQNLGFSLNDNNFGKTFFKEERNDMDCGDNICVESIQGQGVDIGKACYNYQKIVYLFKNSYKTIKLEKQKNTCSILKSLGFPMI